MKSTASASLADGMTAVTSSRTAAWCPASMTAHLAFTTSSTLRNRDVLPISSGRQRTDSPRRAKPALSKATVTYCNSPNPVTAIKGVDRSMLR
jgi:hypothetical protein